MNDILVKVGADISNFSKGMSDAAKQAGQMGRATEKGALTIGKLVAAVGGIKLLSAGFNMVRDSISQAFRRIDTMEQFDRVMTTMTGSSKKAAQVLDTVNDTVVGTAYGLDVAAKSTQNFVTSGMDVDKATDSIGAWGDAVAFYGDGSNEQFGRVTDALSKMTSKGTVQMDRMNQLTEAGIPAMQIYADATGQSVEQVADTMAEGALDADEFITVMNDALRNGTENFAGIEGAAKEAGASWGAAFDNMRAAVARGVTSIIESIDNLLANNGLPSMRDMVAEFGSFFEATLKKIAEAIPNVISAIDGWRDALKPIAPLIIGVATSLGILLAASAILGTVRGLVAGLTGAVALLGRTFGLTAAPMFAIIAVLALVGAAVYQLWQTNEEFRNNVQIIWEHVKQIFSMVLETISGAIVGFIGVLMELITAMMPVIARVAEVAVSFLEWIVTMMETHSWVANLVAIAVVLFGALAVGVPIVAGIVKVFTMVWTVLKTVWTVVTFVAKVFRILFTVVRVVTTVFGLFLSPLGLIIGIATAVGGVIVWLGGHFEWIGNIVDSVTGWMSDAWSGFLSWLGFETEKTAVSAGDSIVGLATTTAQATTDAAQSAETNIGGMHENVNSHFGGMSQYGVGQMQYLNLAGSQELSGLNTAGSGYVSALSTSAQSSMSDMSAGAVSAIGSMSSSVTGDMGSMSDSSIDSVSLMNSDISAMLADLESNGSIDIASLNSSVTSDMGNMSSMSMAEIQALASSGSAEFSGLESDMTSSASNMQSEVESSFSGMSSTIESEMSSIESTASSSLSGLASNFSSSMSDISSAIKSGMQEVSNSIQSGMKSVTLSATAGMVATNSVIAAGTTRMNTTVSQGITRMIQAYTRGFNLINRTTSSNMNRIVNTSRNGMNSVTSAFSSGMNRNASVAQSAGNRIVSIFNRLNGQLRSAGVNAMAGLQSGLNSRSGSVMATARRIANNVASTMRKALKVHSPSRITRAIGGFTGEGLEIGLLKSRNAVLKAADGLAEAAKPNVNMSYATPDGAYGSLSSAVNGAVSVNTQGRDRALIASIDGIRREISQMQMEMDGKVVGRMVEPGVSRKQSRDNSRRKRYPNGRGALVT
ncbi:tape measure protein [Oceanobacillus sojae]|uniref:tape measure protein n=1 Tax=Oceanobacillus sojae TaxID=582851 RepID=UPI00363F8F07